MNGINEFIAHTFSFVVTKLISSIDRLLCVIIAAFNKT
ncbi:hypothetical protein AC26_3119 [Escherichia coli 1-176-05_S3_C2]|nr:hypothetical protein ECSTECB2F1_4682 [Escherichia coli O91:H21 str. B2F1]EYD83636.1 hypothetical protein AC26_3119 [Escherichia coli 1-176-05_S3_C2]